MDYYKEKIIFGLGSAIATTLFQLGAVMSNTDVVRWAYVTLAVSTMTSTSLALLCRKQSESIKVVIGRCGITIMLAIFGSRAFVHWFKLENIQDDILLLGFITMIITIFAYFVGHGSIMSMNSKSNNLGKAFIDFLIAVFKPKP